MLIRAGVFCESYLSMTQIRYSNCPQTLSARSSTCSRCTCSKINPVSPLFLLTSPSSPLSFWILIPFVNCFAAFLSPVLTHINRCNQVCFGSVSRPPTACTLKSLIVLCWTRLMRFDRLSRMRFFFYKQISPFTTISSCAKLNKFSSVCSTLSDQKESTGKSYK